MDYQEAWRYLDNLQFFKIKLGLESMNAFLDDVGHPQRHCRFIHVAGTNGKGSVSVTLLSILASAGYRVGLYTSPHLSSVRERFRINDSFISQEEFAAIATDIRGILAGRQITYFEFTTALAMLWFAREQVDVAILEVGMGGRLDATNVVHPLVSVITNVSMDHEAYLGNTLAEVAFEKAGVIKPGVPVVSGVADDVSRTVVEQTCRERGAELWLLGRDFCGEGAGRGSWNYRGPGQGGAAFSGLPCRLGGPHQESNAALAVATLEVVRRQLPVSEEALRAGLAQVHWPGRMEYFCLDRATRKQLDCPEQGAAAGPPNPALRRYLLDGAHNPAGVATLGQALASSFADDRLIMIWASMADKDVAPMLAAIAPFCTRIILTRAESERSALPERLRELLPESCRAAALCAPTVAEALRLAEELASPADLIGVAGSLYLIGAARRLLLGELVR